MNIKLLKVSLTLAGMLVMSAGPVLAQEYPASNGGMCSIATLRGSFGYTSTGALLPAYVAPEAFLAGPFAEVGIQSFDGRGNTTATATVDANGNITQQVAISGTYVVNPDCTGSMTLSVPAFDAIVHADFVIDHNRTEIRAVSTDSGVIESRIYRKQSWGGR